MGDVKNNNSTLRLLKHSAAFSERSTTSTPPQHRTAPPPQFLCRLVFCEPRKALTKRQDRSRKKTEVRRRLYHLGGKRLRLAQATTSCLTNVDGAVLVHGHPPCLDLCVCEYLPGSTPVLVCRRVGGCPCHAPVRTAGARTRRLAVAPRPHLAHARTHSWARLRHPPPEPTRAGGHPHPAPTAATAGVCPRRCAITPGVALALADRGRPPEAELASAPPR
jgi:hypothetical protein